MSRLWDEDIGTKPGDKENISSSKKLCRKTFDKLGGLRGIVEEHFESQISRLSDEERDIAARIFPFLVTKSGIKIALPVEDLCVYANKGQKKQIEPEVEKQVENLLKKISDLDNTISESEEEDYRLLRSVSGIRGETCYEIFHDMLAEPILVWQTEYNLEEAQRRAIINKGKAIFKAILFGLIVIISIAMVIEKIQRSILDRMSDFQTQYQACTRQGISASCLEERSLQSLSSAAPQQSKWSFKLRGGIYANLYSIREAGIMRILASELSKKEVLLLGKEIPAKNVERFLSLSFSPDGKQIVAGSDDGKLYLWNLRDKPIKEPKILPSNRITKIRSLSFSPDSKQIVAGSDDGMLYLWNLQNKPIKKSKSLLIDKDTEILSVGFSPDGKQIVAGSDDGMLYLWNLQDKPIKEPKILPSNRITKIRSLSFSPDGKQIAAGSDDGMLYLWNLQNKPIKKSKSLLIDKDTEILGVGFSPDGNQITGSADGILRLWKLKNKPDDKPIEAINTNPDRGKLKTINFSPDRKYFAIVFSPSNKQKDSLLQQQIDLWDLDSKQKLYSYPLRLNTEDDEITRISFSPDGEQIAAVTNNGAVKLLPIYTFDELLNEACNLLLDNKNQHKQNKACNLLDKQIENKKQEV